MDFVKRAESFELPLHAAFKAAVHMNERGESVLSEKPIAWKFERYIFDILPFAPQCEVLIYPRDDCFAPLKNKEGMYSPATVQQALSDFDKRVYHSLCDVEVAFPLFELSAEFHYPTQRILDAWRGVVPTNAYVDASSRSV